jgi:hypothetical protein
MENKKITNNGIGFFGLLTIAFIVLKLCGVISWSWIWVLAPLWITWTIALLIALIVVIIKLLVDR